MTTPERQLEDHLIETLQGLKYEYRADIRDRAALERNFREKFETLNHVRPPVPMPSGSSAFAEQQKIADCISALDARIAAEADKLAALKSHKKGLIQQLFPLPEGMA